MSLAVQFNSDVKHPGVWAESRAYVRNTDPPLEVGFPERARPVDIGRSLFELISRAAEQPSVSLVDVVISVPSVTQSGVTAYECRVGVDRIDGPLELWFQDGSQSSLPLVEHSETVVAVARAEESDTAATVTPKPISTTATIPFESLSADDGPVLDVGAAVLQPITVGEWRSLESVLSLLREAAEAGTLADSEQQQILDIADLIRETRRRTEPGKTERWKVVGAVGAGLWLLIERLPAAAVNWIELAEKLEEMGWAGLAEQIRSVF